MSFFQAEDGIRDLVRSRGLGDVYKRQPLALRIALRIALGIVLAIALQITLRKGLARKGDGDQKLLRSQYNTLYGGQFAPQSCGQRRRQKQVFALSFS